MFFLYMDNKLVPESTHRNRYYVGVWYFSLDSTSEWHKSLFGKYIIKILRGEHYDAGLFFVDMINFDDFSR